MYNIGTSYVTYFANDEWNLRAVIICLKSIMLAYSSFRNRVYLTYKSVLLTSHILLFTVSASIYRNSIFLKQILIYNLYFGKHL